MAEALEERHLGVSQPRLKTQNIYVTSLLTGLNLLEAQTEMMSFSSNPAFSCAPAKAHLAAAADTPWIPQRCTGPLATRLFLLPLRPGWGSGTTAGKQHGGGAEALSLPPFPPASTPDSTAGLKLWWEANRCPRGLNHQHTLGHITFYPGKLGAKEQPSSEDAKTNPGLSSLGLPVRTLAALGS